MKRKVTIICGTTASGKSSLALKLANEKPSSIISADSRQVYEDLGIVTGKDIPSGFVKIRSDLAFRDRLVAYYEKENVRFWGFDFLKADESINAAEFVDLTRQIIKKELSKDRNIFIVGGAGFYLKALTAPESLAAIPPSSSLRVELSSASVEDLQQKLWELNPEKFLSLNDSDIKNPRRLIRAIEVALQGPIRPTPDILPPGVDFVWLGLRLPLEKLRLKIKIRVQERLKNGALDEVKELLGRHPDRTLPIYTSLGAMSIMMLLGGKIISEQLVDLWVKEELDYAKRQLTWFKKQNEIIWYDEGEYENNK